MHVALVVFRKVPTVDFRHRSSAVPPLPDNSEWFQTKLKKKKKSLLNLLFPRFKHDNRIHSVPFLTSEHVCVLLPAIFGLDWVVTSGCVEKLRAL